MLGYQEHKRSLIQSLVAKAKSEISYLEAEIGRLESLVIGSVKKAAIEIAENAEPRNLALPTASFTAKPKTKNKALIARKPKKRKYTKRSKYWKK